MSGGVSRREFVVSAATTVLSVGTIRAQQPALTAEGVVARIRENVGVPWREKTIDGFKAGDPATPVTGVATTVMATLDVLRRAATARRNLIVAQEPTFYAADDGPGTRASDPVYLAKRRFIEEQKLVVWRLSDHWNARRPSEAVTALATTLGWSANLSPGADGLYQVPETTLGALAADVGGRLGIRGGLRMVGQPTLRVRTVFLSPGTITLPGAIESLRRADVIVAGEAREWEGVPYALDTWSAGPGQARGMIAIGRVVSQGPGTQACAAWIRSLIPGTPVEAITTADPYWSPLR